MPFRSGKVPVPMLPLMSIPACVTEADFDTMDAGNALFPSITGN